MALQKAVTSPTGAPSPKAYHRLNQMHLDSFGGSIRLTVYAYHDAAARQAGLSPVLVREHTIAGDAFPAYAMAKVTAGRTRYEELATASYEYLKTLQEYEGAQDV